MRNWHSFLCTLDHSTNTKHLYKTINRITNSNNGKTPSLAVLTPTDIPSEKQQANNLTDHYANPSQIGPRKEERMISRRKLSCKRDTTIMPFTPAQTTKSSKTHRLPALTTSPIYISNTWDHTAYQPLQVYAIWPTNTQ